MKKQTVVGLIEVFKRTIIVTNRRGHPNDLCLPGGKIEPGEDYWEALKREIREETGTTAVASYRLFSGPCATNPESEVTTYRLIIDGPMSFQEGEERVRLVRFTALLGERVTFRPYYEALFRHLGWIQ